MFDGGNAPVERSVYTCKGTYRAAFSVSSRVRGSFGRVEATLDPS